MNFKQFTRQLGHGQQETGKGVYKSPGGTSNSYLGQLATGQ